jgi:tetratricopeptide (TPR) repeat protein
LPEANVSHRPDPLFEPLPHGVIVRAFANAFDLEVPRKPSRSSATRYLAGKWVPPEMAAAVVAKLLQEFCEQGVTPFTRELEAELVEAAGQPDAETGGWLVTAVLAAGRGWDDLVGRLATSLAAGPVPSRLALPPLLRISVVDLSVRCAAALRLLGHEPPSAEVPAWAGRATRGKPEELLRRAHSRVPRERMAEELGVKLATLDSWRRGERRPSDPSLVDLGDLLAPALGCDSPSAQSWLKRFYGLRTLCDQIAAVTDGETVEDLAAGWMRLTRALHVVLARAKFQPNLERRALAQIVIGGLQTRPGRSAVGAIPIGDGTDPWSGALRAASRDSRAYVEMLFRLLSVAHELHEQLLASGCSSDAAWNFTRSFCERLEAPEPLAPAPPKGEQTSRQWADARRWVATHHAMHGRRADRLRVLAECLAKDPDHTEIRLDYAEALDEAGHHQPAVEQCLLAAGCSWTRPRAMLYLGVLHLRPKTKEGNAEALSILESLRNELGDAGYLYHLGLARMRAGLFEPALACLRRVLEQRPGHVKAMEAAAHCELMLGRSVPGARSAKDAFHRGRHEIHAAWKARLYRQREKRRRR